MYATLYSLRKLYREIIADKLSSEEKQYIFN